MQATLQLEGRKAAMVYGVGSHQLGAYSQERWTDVQHDVLVVSKDV